ncbi:putative protein kinase RLK-Pelle-LRR-XII-1 family [Rosa chinensis]|uniref:Protein kinase domain-containing protein n=1 Tax=Rosa chinensis TaxID=74649 RepID=A0A2P6SQD3_ROSCH|nr:putative protein kinase RLK-Pelle-LRR-XII-1 family [Rosa chinensis]
MLHYSAHTVVRVPTVQVHLNLIQRVNIAIDVANALDYLHSHFHNPIVHCDLKPKYGMGGAVSTYGDVYSYGILLLEMLTGKRPTDDMFTDDTNLHNLF